jgi:hypothetical protein
MAVVTWFGSFPAVAIERCPDRSVRGGVGAGFGAEIELCFLTAACLVAEQKATRIDSAFFG